MGVLRPGRALSARRPRPAGGGSGRRVGGRLARERLKRLTVRRLRRAPPPPPPARGLSVVPSLRGARSGEGRGEGGHRGRCPLRGGPAPRSRGWPLTDGRHRPGRAFFTPWLDSRPRRPPWFPSARSPSPAVHGRYVPEGQGLPVAFCPLPLSVSWPFFPQVCPFSPFQHAPDCPSCSLRRPLCPFSCRSFLPRFPVRFSIWSLPLHP